MAPAKAKLAKLEREIERAGKQGKELSGAGRTILDALRRMATETLQNVQAVTSQTRRHRS